MRCASCGAENLPGNRFCAGCGRSLVAGDAPHARPTSAGASTSRPGGAGGGFIADWFARFKEEWRRSPLLKLLTIVLFIYLLLTQDPGVLVASLVIAAGMRFLADRLDAPLAPFWPIRDVLPRKLRLVLACVVPLAIGYQIAVSPSLIRLLDWLPYIGPDASVFFFMTAITAFVAYVLVRERAARAPA